MNSTSMRRLSCVPVFLSVFAAGQAQATNGLSMEAYGAKAGGMGGASMAHDSGNSAVMNNPATLGLLKDDKHRFGVGITFLGPDVESTGPAAFGSPSTASDGDLYLLPSISYMKKSGQYTYGVAMLAQGGMGTKYGNAGPGDLFAGGLSFNLATGAGAPVALSGEEIRSEVGVGRLMAPIAFTVNEKLSVAAQLDFIWAGMDIQMDLDGATFADMAFGSNPNVDYGSASGSMVTAFQGAAQAGMVTDVNWARFDFSNDNDFTGEARGYGLGAKIGFVYSFSPELMIGATYHTKSSLDDLQSSDATVSFNGEGMAFGGGPIGVTGDIDVIDFQWPATMGIGMAYQLNDKVLLAGDVRHLFWKEVMDGFTLRFTADQNQANPAAAGFAGTQLEATLKQEWDDQTVVSIGAQYRYSDKLMLRVGANLADNPVPDTYMNPLFPAIVENHYTVGFGYRFAGGHRLGGALAYAPEVNATNSQNQVESAHSQTTWRFNYVYDY